MIAVASALKTFSRKGVTSVDSDVGKWDDWRHNHVMLPRRDLSRLLLIAAILGGCGTKSDPAPPLAACNNPATCNPRIIVANQSTGGSSNGGAASTSGITLEVNAVQFNGSSGVQAWSPADVQSLDGTFEVHASAINGGVTTNTSTNSIELQNVDNTGNGWVSVKPSANNGFYPGMHAVPLDSGSSLTVPLLRVTDFDFVPTLLSTAAVAIDTTKAQLVVKIVDGNGDGVSGLTVSNLGGDVMVYADRGDWVDASLGQPFTDESGRVIAINLDASPSAVRLATFTATGPSTQGVLQSKTGLFPIQSGFVTYGTLQFE